MAWRAFANGLFSVTIRNNIAERDEENFKRCCHYLPAICAKRLGLSILMCTAKECDSLPKSVCCKLKFWDIQE